MEPPLQPYQTSQQPTADWCNAVIVWFVEAEGWLTAALQLIILHVMLSRLPTVFCCSLTDGSRLGLFAISHTIAVPSRELLTNLDPPVPDNLDELDQLESVLPLFPEQDLDSFHSLLESSPPQFPPLPNQPSLSSRHKSEHCLEEESSLNDGELHITCSGVLWILFRQHVAIYCFQQ